MAIGSFNGYSEIKADITECSEEDLGRLAEVCKEKLTPSQRSVQNLTTVLLVYSSICHVHNENAEIQGKVSRVAATVLNTLNDALRAGPKDLREKVFLAYSSCVLKDLYIRREGDECVDDLAYAREEANLPLQELPSPLEQPLPSCEEDDCVDKDQFHTREEEILFTLNDALHAGPKDFREQKILSLKDLSIEYEMLDHPLDTFARSMLRAANELYDIYPEQAKNCVEYVNRLVAEIDYCKRNQTPQALQKLPSPICLLQLKGLVSELNYTTDPQWELKLRTVLRATRTLFEKLQERVASSLLDPITQLWQGPKFPGFARQETVELLRSLFRGYFTWPYEHPKEMSALLSPFEEKIVTKLEQALAYCYTDTQIACVNELVKLRSHWKDIPLTARPLDKTIAQGLPVKDLAKRFPKGEAYKILSDLAPEVAHEYVNILFEELKSRVCSCSIIYKKGELDQMAKSQLSLYVPEAGSMIQMFVDQQLAAILSDIVQGRVSLETVKDRGDLLGEIVKRYKNNIETLVKTLGDSAKTFFKIYSEWKLMKIPLSLSVSGELDGSLEALKDYIQIPPEFRALDSRTFGTDPDRPDTYHPEFLKTAMETVFDRISIMSEKQSMRSVYELMKFGQLCYWLKKLIFQEMPSLDLPDDIFKAFVKQIAGCVPHDPDVDMVDQATEKPSTWVLQSLDGNGYEDPVALIQALPLNEAQKARLLQVYRQTS